MEGGRRNRHGVYRPRATMIEIDIPGFGELRLSDLVCDYNGTLAVDGTLLPGVADALSRLAAELRMHVITADTFGTARVELAGLPVEVVLIPGMAQAEAKLEYLKQLGADRVVAIGNGRNDRMMLAAAAIGIVLVQQEGAAGEAVQGADIVAPDILDALALLEHPRRLVATLRS
jgi:soluble P-type ATPase